MRQVNKINMIGASESTTLHQLHEEAVFHAHRSPGLAALIERICQIGTSIPIDRCAVLDSLDPGFVVVPRRRQGAG